MSSHRRLKTGIDGLDLILDGGIRYPSDGSVFMVVLGGPGTGKTHLALELAVRTLAHPGDEDSIHLYYGLDQGPSEIHAKLEEDFGYFGAFEQAECVATVETGPYAALVHRLSRADGPDRHLLSATLKDDESSLAVRDAADLFQLIDKDLGALTEAASLGAAMRPGLVVVDNVSLAAFESGSDARGALRRIRQLLRQQRLHGVFVVETPEEAGSHAHHAATEYSADVIVRLGYHAFADQFKERSIEIDKARHQFYFRGTHHFSIVGRSGDATRGARGERAPGIHLYPSIPTLLSHFHYHTRAEPSRSEALPTGIADLAVRGTSSNGLIGPPETLPDLRKLALRFLVADGGPGLLVSFLESGEQILRWAEPERSAHTIALSFEPEYLSTGKFLKDVHDEILLQRERGRPLQRVALVGLEHLRWGFPLLHDAKMLIPWLTVFFRHQQLTCLFVETASARSLEDSAVIATAENLLRVEGPRDGQGSRLSVARSLSSNHATGEGWLLSELDDGRSGS